MILLLQYAWQFACRACHKTSIICKVAPKQFTICFETSSICKVHKQVMMLLLLLPVKMKLAQPPTKLKLAPTLAPESVTLNFNCIESWAAANFPNLCTPPLIEGWSSTDKGHCNGNTKRRRGDTSLPSSKCSIIYLVMCSLQIRSLLLWAHLRWCWWRRSRFHLHYRFDWCQAIAFIWSLSISQSISLWFLVWVSIPLWCRSQVGARMSTFVMLLVWFHFHLLSLLLYFPE